MDAMTYQRWDQSQTILVKGATGVKVINPISSVPLFFQFSEVSKYRLVTENHVHIS